MALEVFDGEDLGIYLDGPEEGIDEYMSSDDLFFLARTLEVMENLHKEWKKVRDAWLRREMTKDVIAEQGVSIEREERHKYDFSNLPEGLRSLVLGHEKKIYEPKITMRALEAYAQTIMDETVKDEVKKMIQTFQDESETYPVFKVKLVKETPSQED